MKKPLKMYVIKSARPPYEILKATPNAQTALNFCKKLDKNFVPYTMKTESIVSDDNRVEE